MITASRKKSSPENENEKVKKTGQRGAGIRCLKALLAAALAFAAASCATMPAAPAGAAPETAEFRALPRGGAVYLFADARRAGPLVSALPLPPWNNRQAEKMLRLTDKAAAVFFPGGKDFFAAAWGAYPRLRVNIALALSAGWKKRKSPAGGWYWHSASHGLSVSPGSALTLISSGDPLALAPEEGGSAASLVPERFAAFRSGAALSGWVASPEERAAAVLSALGLPLQIPAQELSFALFGKDGGWELALLLKTASPSQARALSALLSLARTFAAPSPVDGRPPEDALSLLFANPPVQDGPFLTLRSGPLAPAQITLLFRAFSLHSN
jgi:hypothetical protein